MQHKLQQISISGYKSIREQKVDIGDLNVLIGPNGAGKSNFVGVFKFLRNVIEQRLQHTVRVAGRGAEPYFFYGTKITKEISISLDFDPNYYVIKLLPTVNDGILIAIEQAIWKKITVSSKNDLDPTFTESLYPVVVSQSSPESNLGESKQEISKYVYKTLKDWRVYHFHDTSDSAGVKKTSALADSRFLFEDAANLAAFLFVLKESKPEHYQRIVKTIQLVIPFFKDFVLLPNQLNKETIRLEWQDKYSDKTFTAADLSDGSLRFICMATLLLQPDLPKLILLDEPELGLHPSAITILAGLLKKASTRTQVIISTQSVSLVNEFDAEDIIVVEREGQETVFHRLDPEKLGSWLDEYSLGDLWDKNIIGGRP